MNTKLLSLAVALHLAVLFGQLLEEPFIGTTSAQKAPGPLAERSDYVDQAVLTENDLRHAEEQGPRTVPERPDYFGERVLAENDLRHTAAGRYPMSGCGLFSPGGKTIGGPGSFSGYSDGKNRTLLESLGSHSFCATVRNTGESTIRIILSQGYRSGGDGGAVTHVPVLLSELEPGETRTLCGEAISVVSVLTLGNAGEILEYDWRVDETTGN